MGCCGSGGKRRKAYKRPQTVTRQKKITETVPVKQPEQPQPQSVTTEAPETQEDTTPAAPVDKRQRNYRQLRNQVVINKG